MVGMSVDVAFAEDDEDEDADNDDDGAGKVVWTLVVDALELSLVLACRTASPDEESAASVNGGDGSFCSGNSVAELLPPPKLSLIFSPSFLCSVLLS